MEQQIKKIVHNAANGAQDLTQLEKLALSGLATQKLGIFNTIVLDKALKRRGIQGIDIGFSFGRAAKLLVTIIGLGVLFSIGIALIALIFQ